MPHSFYGLTYIAAMGGADALHNKKLYGGKGAGLLDMAGAGLPVPEALVLTTAAWQEFRATGKLNTTIEQAIVGMLDAYPDSMFSVRSGAPVSMPGMMDTVLNVGVTDELDMQYEGAYKRFALAWLEIVKGVPKDRINKLVQMVDERVAFTQMEDDPAQSADRYRKLLRGVIQSAEQVSVPDGRFEQAEACVKAVFQSWDTPRAKAYRKMHDIPEDMGTGCVIQRMVMGTAPGLSGSGVMFSRDPATGEAKVTGEIAFNAQGEEVVNGSVTPLNLDGLFHTHKGLHSELCALALKLEDIYGDVQDIEFTVENGVVYVLQTRTAKMSAKARIETACTLAKNAANPELSLKYVKERVTRGMVLQTMVPVVDTEDAPLTTGLAASPGAISGTLVSPKATLSAVNKNCILVAEDTSPDDFPIMSKCGGILTKTGGFTCHSAVVARGIGVPAVVGAGELKFTMKGVVIGGTFFAYGTEITLCGTTGTVYGGAQPVKKAQPPRSIYGFLHDTILKKGLQVPPSTYYYDCGIGERVCLPINPDDTERLERQLERADRLLGKGKDVVLGFEMQGLGEDMFDMGIEHTFQKLAYSYAPDFQDKVIAYGIPPEYAQKAQSLLGVIVNTTEDITVLDLLDLLEVDA